MNGSSTSAPPTTRHRVGMLLYPTHESPITGDKIKDANGGFGSVNGIGKVILDVDDGIMGLEDVRYVPTLTYNLASHGHLEDQGFTLGVSHTKPFYHTISTPSGDVFCAYKNEYTGMYRIGSCTQMPTKTTLRFLHTQQSRRQRSGLTTPLY